MERAPRAQREETLALIRTLVPEYTDIDKPPPRRLTRRPMRRRAGHFMADQPIARALISVSDKSGLVEFAENLARHQVQSCRPAVLPRPKRGRIAVTEFPPILNSRKSWTVASRRFTR